MAGKHVEALERVHGAEHLLQGAAVGVELETKLLTIADESMTTSRETLPIDLVTVPQPRLHNPVASVDLQNQAVNVGNDVLVDVGQVGRNDSPEEKTAETGGGFDGQHEMSKREASRRRVRARVEDFDFSEQL